MNKYMKILIIALSISILVLEAMSNSFYFNSFNTVIYKPPFLNNTTENGTGFLIVTMPSLNLNVNVTIFQVNTVRTINSTIQPIPVFLSFLNGTTISINTYKWVTFSIKQKTFFSLLNQISSTSTLGNISINLSYSNPVNIILIHNVDINQFKEILQDVNDSDMNIYGFYIYGGACIVNINLGGTYL